MLHNLGLNKRLWTIIAALILSAGLIGSLDRHVYDRVLSPDLIPGSAAQDVFTVAVAALLLWLIRTIGKYDYKKQICVLGIVASYFYLYGIFAIERVYNYGYLLYLAIFALCFWSLAYALTQIDRDFLRTVELPLSVLRTTAWSSLAIAALFNCLWIAALIPLMRLGNRIDHLYSIYVLDLVFVMPAFTITAILSLRRNELGMALAPAMMITGFFVIFPLGLGEIAKPHHGLRANTGSMVVSFAFSALMLAIGFLHLGKMRVAD